MRRKRTSRQFENTSPGTATIPRILAALKHHDVMLIPEESEHVRYTEKLMKKVDADANRRLDLIFTNTRSRIIPEMSALYEVNMTEPVFIRHGNPVI